MTLPAGVVTFLFSDIEGSTRKWESDPEGMARSLARHDEIVQQRVSAANGHVFKHTGDGFAAAFESAEAALVAAVSVATALEGEAWEGPALRCRFGIHTGDATPRDGDYFGPTVTRTARLMDSGNGGQLIASDIVHLLVGGATPPGLEFVSVGARRLRDLGEPIELFRVSGGPFSDDRPLRTLDSVPHNLPVSASEFVGRGDDIDALVSLLGDRRMVTLTGIGGVGKTRLALEVATRLIDRFSDGVWLVELAATRDPSLLGETIAQSVGAPTDPTRPGLARAIEHLRDANALVVLDNCEHVIDGAAHAAEALVQAGPNVVVLATSREGLAIDGERLWRVPSLGLEDDGAALQLFEVRAQNIDPEFALSEDNRETVRSICARLDGIPLAIELATARLSLLDVAQISTHLDDRFRLLTGGSRTAVERQRTLRAMMDWSYDLLADDEQLVLDRLGVFAGGFTGDVASAVVSDDRIPEFLVLELLDRLVRASLVKVERAVAAVRFHMLETVRQYALEKLVARGESDGVRARHAEFVRVFAAGYDDLVLADRPEAIRLGNIEIANVRAALDWAVEHGQGELALEIAVHIRQLFWLQVLHAEFVGWIQAALALVEDHPLVPRALSNALVDSRYLSALTPELLARANALYESTDDPEVRGELANGLGGLLTHADPRRSDELHRVAHQSLRDAGSNRWPHSLQNRVVTALTMLDASGAEEIIELSNRASVEGLGEAIHVEAMRITFDLLAGDYEATLAATSREPSDPWERFWFNVLRSMAFRALGDPVASREAIEIADKVAGNQGRTFTSWNLALAELDMGDADAAVAGFKPALVIANERTLVTYADGAVLNGIVAADDDPGLAARSFGFGRSLAERISRRQMPHDEGRIVSAMEATRNRLPSDFDGYFSEGAALTWDELDTSRLA